MGVGLYPSTVAGFEKTAVAYFGSEDCLDLSHKDMGRPTSKSAVGRPIVTTAKIAGLTVPNSHMENITNSTTTRPIKRLKIRARILAP